MLIASLAGDAPVSVPPFDAVTFDLCEFWLDGDVPDAEPRAGEGSRAQEAPAATDE